MAIIDGQIDTTMQVKCIESEFDGIKRSSFTKKLMSVRAIYNYYILILFKRKEGLYKGYLVEGSFYEAELILKKMHSICE